ncbi:ABC transporter permease [Bifidobacterium callimiconis]|uniref:ABC transporter permease n=1 Tax=Bifidobacterium callimiconis TaxID=2306973 RepID=A0A430FI70_9BIFI|nr:FtsX-like permease family protein [Bifidobacterium callimiconis]MBT1176376.1 FtsX-like permease family protein [Bifidobacterium callimiconis]RSX52500.1 ABC transporter permease [Bifidobacterium callimiconis]
MSPHISLARLPLENLRRKPFRTASLITVVAILSVAFFGGSMLAMNLNKGLTSMEERLGADLMVVPQTTESKAEALLTDGTPNTFYFTNDIESKVSKADGIAQITSQTYISSLAAACCAEKLQIIGFDPQTDFVIEPWVASQYDKTLGDGQMVAGANVNVSTDGTIELYGKTWPVVAQLASTGTSLDNSVFVNKATVPQMVAASAKVAKRVMPQEYASKAVSSVLIKVQDGYDAHTVANNIAKLDPQLASVGFVYPGGVTASTKTSLNTMLSYMLVFVVVLWVMGLIVMLAVFSSSVNERKKEFASLRIMGATRGMLISIVIREALITGLAGGVIGVAAASLIVFPFSGYIGKQMQLPYLQVGIGSILVMALIALVFAVFTAAVASLFVAFRLGRPEAYLTLREGE